MLLTRAALPTLAARTVPALAAFAARRALHLQLFRHEVCGCGLDQTGRIVIRGDGELFRLLFLFLFHRGVDRFGRLYWLVRRLIGHADAGRRRADAQKALLPLSSTSTETSSRSRPSCFKAAWIAASRVSPVVSMNFCMVYLSPFFFLASRDCCRCASRLAMRLASLAASMRAASSASFFSRLPRRYLVRMISCTQENTLLKIQ